MKMPVAGGLALRPRLDVLIEPLRRLGNRRNAMRLAAPDANHRDDEKYRGGGPEQRASHPTATNRAHDLENRSQNNDPDLYRQGLRRMKTHSYFAARHQQQIDERRDDTHPRRVGQHRGPFLRNTYACDLM